MLREAPTTSSRSPGSLPATGRRSGRPTRSSGSTRKSNAAPTSSGCSPTPRCSASPAGPGRVPDEWQVITERRRPLRTLHGTTDRQDQGGGQARTHDGMIRATTRTESRNSTTRRDVAIARVAGTMDRFRGSGVRVPSQLHKTHRSAAMSEPRKRSRAWPLDTDSLDPFQASLARDRPPRAVSTSSVRPAHLGERPGYADGPGALRLHSPFGDLAELWPSDLEGTEISEGTKENYRDDSASISDPIRVLHARQNHHRPRRDFPQTAR